MQVRFLLGPAGSGKTFRCLSEARQSLAAAPEGLPIILLAPKQGTYQLEQQLLASTALWGYTRLSILSFESLAQFVLESLGEPEPALISDEGRVMVLRSLLSKQRQRLKVFRASARLTGFAQEVSQVLSAMQQSGLDSQGLNRIAGGAATTQGLKRKLEDLAAIMEAYEDWLVAHSLKDRDALLKRAIGCLQKPGAPPPLVEEKLESLRAGSQGAKPGVRNRISDGFEPGDRRAAFRLENIWVDGFAEFSGLELDLLAGLLPYCEQMTVTFCLDRRSAGKAPWLSHWSLVEQALKKCRSRFETVAGAQVRREVLPEDAATERFASSSALRFVQEQWDAPHPIRNPAEPVKAGDGAHRKDICLPGAGSQRTIAEGDSIRLLSCASPEGEVIAAAREVLKFARAGGRYREVAVLVRSLEPYHHLFQRVFDRYEIPFFLDRREQVSHHPLAELTRSALRVAAFDWRQEDWFAALKTGLVPVAEQEIDLLENEALARGWAGAMWLRPIELKEAPRDEKDEVRLRHLGVRLEGLRREIVPHFERLAVELAAARNRPTGPQLAEAVRGLWKSLNVEKQLQAWDAAAMAGKHDLRGTPVHESVWRQMESWLENAALAFGNDSLSLREWIPILEAGLSSLTVGIIPPALDQVLIGAVDRTRTPEVKLALVLGLNEGVFPTKPQTTGLLSEEDRVELERHQISVGPTLRLHLGRERYLGYIAFTRPREQLVLTWSAADEEGASLNPSALISQIRSLFPGLEPKPSLVLADWIEAQHTSEWVESVLRSRAAGRPVPTTALGAWESALDELNSHPSAEKLPPEVALRLYGTVLRTSVSRIEQFAACPFKFFVHSGLRAEERRLFELDAKEQGTFQHDVLALFHQSLKGQGKRWRDISPQEARALVSQIAGSLLADFRQGLFQAGDQARFTARVLTESLQDFVEVLVDWMKEQYLFDPIEVELPFGDETGSPAWSLKLADGNQIAVRGRIDRVDLWRDTETGRGLCVVVDYKSSEKKLDATLMQNGLQLQLLTYLNVLRHWPDARSRFGVEELEPAGVFYVNLRGRYERGGNRQETLADLERGRRLAYRHSGRFHFDALPYLDKRPKGESSEQFNYRLTKTGALHGACREPLRREQFQSLLSESTQILREMGERVYSGDVSIDPFRKGRMTACDQCLYQAICRIDPWTHRFRSLARRNDEAAEARISGGEGIEP